MGVADEALEDGVGQPRIADQVVPTLDRPLADDQSRAAAVALLDDVEQVAAPLGAERLQAPVVEDQELDPAQRAQQARMAAGAERALPIASHW